MKGPGAGVEVTVAGVFADVMNLKLFELELLEDDMYKEVRAFAPATVTTLAVDLMSLALLLKVPVMK